MNQSETATDNNEHAEEYMKMSQLEPFPKIKMNCCVLYVPFLGKMATKEYFNNKNILRALFHRAVT
jgi:hypothetical protein